MGRLFRRSKKDNDLQEIFSHVEQIKLEREQTDEVKSNELEPVELNKDNTGITVGEINNISPDDLFEIVATIEESADENEEILEDAVSKMKVGADSTGTCDMCGRDIVFEKNLSGLVIKSRFFACENCCLSSSEEELDNWTESKMANPEDVKPIALWLMQEKNKTQLV